MKFVKGRSGNPKGRPPKGRTLTDLINQKLDKPRFVKALLELAYGGKEISRGDQLAAAKLVLGYVDGLPIARTEIERGESVTIQVTYVEANRIAIASAPRSAAEGNPGIEPVQRRLLRPAVGENGLGDGSPDTSSAAREARGVVRAELPIPE